jgi:hypothetical protein
MQTYTCRGQTYQADPALIMLYAADAVWEGAE